MFHLLSCSCAGHYPCTVNKYNTNHLPISARWSTGAGGSIPTERFSPMFVNCAMVSITWACGRETWYSTVWTDPLIHLCCTLLCGPWEPSMRHVRAKSRQVIRTHEGHGIRHAHGNSALNCGLTINSEGCNQDGRTYEYWVPGGGSKHVAGKLWLLPFYVY